MKAKKELHRIKTRRGIHVIAEHVHDMNDLISGYRRRYAALRKYGFLTHNILSGAPELANHAQETLYLLGADVYKSPLSQYKEARGKGYKHES